MPKGQYDRAAAKAKRPMASEHAAPYWPEGAKPLDAALDSDSRFGSFTLPPVGTEIPIRLPRTDETAGNILELVQLRAEIAKKDDLIARYKLLLKRNGLWLDE